MLVPHQLLGCVYDDPLEAVVVQVYLSLQLTDSVILLLSAWC